MKRLFFLFCSGALLGLGSTARAQSDADLAAPLGGWTAQAPSNSFVQDIHYPASRVNLRSGVSVSAQIRGSIKKMSKGSRPATLVVNGIAMPLESDEGGNFARPYAFGAGSNSVQVRAPNAGAPKRVQFYDAATGASRARLRIVLSWDSPGTDMDLHVISPSGQHCFYGHRIIKGGGALDVDVTTGFGPEIFATAAPEPGAWHVYVNYFGGGAPGQSLSTAQVAVISDEGTLKESQRLFRLPLRSTGEIKHVASFSVL